MKYVRKKPRTKLIDELDDIMLEILCYQRGKKCEICGGQCRLGLFHILPKGTYRKIRYSKMNLLIAGWYCCHFIFHHDYYKCRDRIIPRIKELRGDDYEEKLVVLNLTAKPLSMERLRLLKRAFTKELKALERGWVHG